MRKRHRESETALRMRSPYLESLRQCKNGENGRYNQMSQLSKTVYFPDYPKSDAGRSGLTLPFPDGFTNGLNFVEHLSSYSIRTITGYESFYELERDAKLASTPTATYLRERLLSNAKFSNLERGDYRAALQATFAGGKGTLLHDWYPYLEGYSPDFVSTIIEKYAPNAKQILDPFCGSGTTAITAILRGIDARYSEVNPVCRFIIDAKIAALRLKQEERARIATALEAMAEGVDALLRTSDEDADLKSAFRGAFADSIFFDAPTFSQVLKLRTIADRLTTEDVQLGRFFTVSVLRSLVQGSLLVRRGDLRFRTAAELAKSPPRLMQELRLSLRLIASDLHDAPMSSSAAQLVCKDARELSANMDASIDAIITSPPYLNGTNYFRNTKIELWFLRELSSKQGLRSLRDAAITSGINDVTSRKTNGTLGVAQSSTLAEVMEKFRGNSYDVRIPMMVQAYFGEMAGVIKNFYDVLKPGGVAAIDLGDSCYGSVWVPTDKILAELMLGMGFEQVDQIILRERQSRDGRKLGQTLQVFRKPKGRRQKLNKPKSKALDSTISKGWSAFKRQLPHQLPPMAARNWGNPLHSLCSYQGKLKPSIAHSLINALLPKGSRILDPFAGVGTIPFEAQLMGHQGFGFDISPAAIAISRAKIEPINEAKVFDLLDLLGKRLQKKIKVKASQQKSVDEIRFNGPLRGYFHPDTLAEILEARSFFTDHPPTDGASALVFSAMLHILHGNRPYALSRRSHPITPFAPTGPFEYRPVMERLRSKIGKSLVSYRVEPNRSGRVYAQDATAAWPSEVNDLDAVITSPPFFDSTRFHTANWMRLWFAGWESKDFKERPSTFVDERQKIGFDVYRSIFEQSAERLKPGGLFLIHLGKSKKCDMAASLESVAAPFLESLDAFTESVEHCESHGIRDKGTVTHHQYVLMRRR